jgi:hypothetical protein
VLSHWSYIAQDCDHDALGSDIVVRSQAVSPDLVADVFGLLVGCAYGHYNDHLAVLIVKPSEGWLGAGGVEVGKQKSRGDASACTRHDPRSRA